MDRTVQARQQAQLLGGGLLLLVLALCFFYLIGQSARPRAAKVLETALSRLEQQQDYALTIVEKAPRYELSFQGSVEKGTQLKGVLPAYDLEVLLAEGRLRLRHEEDGEWVKAESLGLHGLSGFLTTPLELLQGSSSSFSRALAGEKVTLGENSCQTLYFPVSDPEIFVQKLFPEIDYRGISEVTMGAALTEPDLEIKQLRVLLEFADDEDEKIERSYYLDN